MESGEGIERLRSLSQPSSARSWNPVKELKVPAIDFVVGAFVVDVESGEGIERDVPEYKLERAATVG